MTEHRDQTGETSEPVNVQVTNSERSEDWRSSLQLVLLETDHEKDLASLVHHVGWAVAPGKLKAMLSMGHGVGYFNGTELIASSILFSYGVNLGFLGMVIVHPNWQRRGLGATVVKACLKQAEELGIQKVGLLATDAGYPLYQSLGFRTVDYAHRYIGSPQLPDRRSQRPLQTREASGASARSQARETPAELTGIHISALTHSDFAEVVELDGQVSGADRKETYETFVETVRYAVVARDEGQRLLGYGMATEIGDLLLIGPLHAKELSVATTLAEHLMQHATGQVRMDVPAIQTRWMEQLKAWGLVDTHVSPMMLLGGEEFPGRREWLFSVMDAALG